MNLLFISPHFPPHFHLFCAALRRHGVRVLGLGDTHPGDLRAELRDSLADYVGMDLSDGENVLRAVAGLISRHGRIHAVESLNEHWLGLEAQLREDFNIPGPRPADMGRLRSKSGMKRVFLDAGVPCAPGEVFTTPARLRAFAAEVGFPFILKPDTGVGASSTYKITDGKTLEDALGRDLRGMFCEKWVQGDLYSYDGLADREGRIIFLTANRYSAGVMEFLHEQRDVAYHTLRDLPPGMEETGRRMMEAFHLRARFFHLELWRLADGTWSALEGNFRPPGGFSTDLMNYGTDADVYDLWARVMAGVPVPATPPPRRWLCAHVSRRRGHGYARSHDELMRLAGNALMYFREIPPVLSGAMGNLAYVVRYPDDASLQSFIRAAHEPGTHPCFPWE